MTAYPHLCYTCGMYDTILEYLTNADKFYQLWMVADLQNPDGRAAVGPERPAKSKMNSNLVRSREDWQPELVKMFDDVRCVPGIVRLNFPQHQLDNEFRFHSGNGKATLITEAMELFWGVGGTDIIETHVIPHPMRGEGPAKITFTDLRMWHHQNTLHRRRGDAIVCAQADFEWNTKSNTKGAYRGGGPYKVTVKNFRAQYNMGVLVKADYDQISVQWGTHNGLRLGENRVAQVVDHCDIKLNYLQAGDTVFDDAGEEFIFWTEIDR